MEPSHGEAAWCESLHATTTHWSVHSELSPTSQCGLSHSCTHSSQSRGMILGSGGQEQSRSVFPYRPWLAIATTVSSNLVLSSEQSWSAATASGKSAGRWSFEAKNARGEAADEEEG